MDSIRGSIKCIINIPEREINENEIKKYLKR